MNAAAAKCGRCLDSGLYWSEFACAQVYCDCAAGDEAKDTGCLDGDDAPDQPRDFGDL